MHKGARSNGVLMKGSDIGGSNSLPFFRQLVDSLSEAVIVTDSQGRIVYVNKATETLFGLAAPEIIGKLANFLIPAKELNGRTEVKVRRKNGRSFYADVEVSEFSHSGERYTVIVVRDSTDKILMRQELESTKELYEIVINNMHDTVVLVDRMGIINFVSPSVKRLFGYDPEEVIGTHILEFVHPEDRKFIEGKLKEPGKTQRLFECRVITKNGEIRYCQATSEPVYRNGIIVGFAGSIRDITEVKKVEKELLESEEKFRMLAEKSVVGIYLIQDMNFVYVNPKFAEIFGYEVHEMIGRSVLDFIHPDDKELVRRNIELRVRGDVDSINYSLKIVRKDGQVRFVEVYGSRIAYRGRPAVIGTLIDRTEEIKLREKLEEYRRFYENAEDMFFIIDSAGKFVEVNPRFAEMMRCSKEELIGLTARPFVDPNEIDWVRENFRRVLNGERVRYKAKAIAKNGREFIMEVTLWPIIENGRVVGAEGILRDITEREKLEERLKELNRFLAASNRINKAIARRMPEDRLMRYVCHTLVRVGVLAASWIAVKRKDELSLVAQSGFKQAASVLKVCRHLTDVVTKQRVRVLTCPASGCSECKLADLHRKVFTLLTPIRHGKFSYGVLAAVSETEFPEEAVRQIIDIARNIGFALRYVEVMRDRELALMQLRKNLEKFETLADKLRNPVAIIKGYLEVRSEIGSDEKVFNEIEKQTCRIENILDELAEEETKTYLIDRLLRSLD